jgi:hypothetical protein
MVTRPGNVNTRRNDVAAYVATMAGELKAMVEPQGLTTLVYLLELVRLEAELCAAENQNRIAEVNARG